MKEENNKRNRIAELEISEIKEILEIKELTKKRDEFYEELRAKLTPIILQSIKDAEKTRGYLLKMELGEKLENAFGLARGDYESVIYDLAYTQKLIEDCYSAGVGGYLKTKTK
jgi:hypothetical protein